MKTTNCPECEEETKELYELVGSKACENCWREYWQENNIGEEESFTDFKNITLTKVK